VASGAATWQQGLTLIIISGAVFLLLSFLKVREDMVRVMPKNLKVGVGAAIGLFLARLGFANSGLINSTCSALGDFSNPSVRLTAIGLLIMIVLSFVRVKIKGKVYQIRGSILIGIMLITVIGLFTGVTQTPSSVVTSSFKPLGDVIFKFSFDGIWQLSFIPYLIIFFIGDFFSTLGTALGLGAKAKMLDKDGNLPGIGRVFLVDAFGSVAGGVMGLTTITTYVESAAGVEAGARTGFASVITSILFFLSMLFAPIFISIPTAATAPALIMVGISMMEVLRDVDFDPIDWTPVALMMFLTVLMNDFAAGIAIGVFSHVIIHLCIGLFSGDKKKLPSIGTVILSLLMLTKFISF
jgi:AGZA family xanthine/uracil permease-like MFS transporter